MGDKINKALEQEYAHHKRRISMLQTSEWIEELSDIRFISQDTCTVFVNCDYDNYLKTLKKIKASGNDFVFHDYYFNDPELAIRHRIPNGFMVAFLCSDTENALKRISKGKCSITEKTRVEKEVVCNV